MNLQQKWNFLVSTRPINTAVRNPVCVCVCVCVCEELKFSKAYF